MERSKDWFKQSQKDLSAAKSSLDSEHFEWTCFQAQQSAEKAMKALLLSRNIKALYHSLVYLHNRWVEYLETKGETMSKEFLEKMQELDHHYLQARYPNSFSEGYSAEYYNKRKAQECVDCAETIISYVEGQIQ